MDDQIFFEASSVQVLVPHDNPVNNVDPSYTNGDGPEFDFAGSPQVEQRSVLFFGKPQDISVTS